MIHERRIEFLVKIFNEEKKHDFLKEKETWVIRKFFAVSEFFNK